MNQGDSFMKQSKMRWDNDKKTEKLEKVENNKNTSQSIKTEL